MEPDSTQVSQPVGQSDLPMPSSAASSDVPQPTPNPVVPPTPIDGLLAQQAASSAPSVAGSGASLSAHAPAVADDADLIEKEWVTKAKTIVSQTKNDPREQSKEINKFKADYLKKRYNKDIKVSET